MTSIFDSPEMIGAFLDEAEEQLQLLEEGIMDLESNGGSPETIQKIFRVAHTLKGSSSAMRFDKMKQLTHEMENVLDKIWNNNLKVSKQVIDTLFLASDYLWKLKNDFLIDQKYIKTDISSVLDSLRGLITAEDKTATAQSVNKEIKTEEASTEAFQFNLDDEQQQRIAPAGYQIFFKRKSDGSVIINVESNSPIETLYKPSVTVALISAAQVFKNRLVTVIMTGMGNDGLAGCEEVKKYNGKVIVEAEETCVVYGMPKVVYEAGLADKQVPLPQIFHQVLQYI